jgi:hypothetical protein
MVAASCRTSLIALEARIFLVGFGPAITDASELNLKFWLHSIAEGDARYERVCNEH